MQKVFLTLLLFFTLCPSAFADQSNKAALPSFDVMTGGSDHWVALNADYLLEIVESHEETLTPQEWDSQMIIRAKLAQLPKVVKALRYLASEKSKSTIKAMRILGVSDLQTPELRSVVAEHMRQFDEIKKQLEAALLPEDDDSDLEE